MHIRKNLLLLIAAALLVSALPLFAQAQQEDGTTEIGISKIITHPALDAVEQGIQDELAALGVENVSYDLQNANGDISTASSIAQKFKADRVDMAIGIATPTAQALANTITDVPVIYAAITDPVAAGLVDSYDKGQGNITGVSDMTPVKDQIKLMAEIVDIDALGHVYTSGEANAVQLAEMTEEACDELGIEFVSSSISNSSEVKQATQSIIGRVDAIYVSTDNTVVSALPSVASVAMQNNVPIISADPTSSEGLDIMVSWGFDYYKMGRATGRLVKDILDGADPDAIGTVFMTDPSDMELWINLDVADALGIDIPQDMLDKAAVIIKDGEKQ